MATKKKKSVKVKGKLKTVKAKPAKAKPAPKKKKTTKKKVVKVVKNPHEGKRHFRIEISGRGGEFILGTTTDEFVQYWLDEERSNMLADHVMAMNDAKMYEDDGDENSNEIPDGFDENSPEVQPGYKYIEYWDIDDLEHDSMVCSEYSTFSLTEVKLHERTMYSSGNVDWNDGVVKDKKFDWCTRKYTDLDNTNREFTCSNNVYNKEVFISSDKESMIDPVPVIALYDHQKGTFGEIFIETNGEDFDEKKFAHSIMETSLDNFFDHYYYDKKLLYVSTDNLDTYGKGFHAIVGYVEASELEFDYDEMRKLGFEELDNQ